MTVARIALADDFALHNLQGGEQAGGALALVIVSHRAQTSLLHGQSGLSAGQCLDLGLLVHAKHQGLVGRIQVNADTVKAFCAARKERFTDPASGLGKADLRLLVDEIKLDGNELVVTGSHRRLADAFGFIQKRKLGEVPSFVNDWRARQDLNLRRLGS